MNEDERCHFLPISPIKNGRSFYRCDKCRTKTPRPLMRPPNRRCRVIEPIKERKRLATNPCKNIGEIRRELAAGTVTCGSAIIRLYYCKRFDELVSRRQIRDREARETLLQIDSQYKGRTCAECEAGQASVLLIGGERWRHRLKRFSEALTDGGIANETSTARRQADLHKLIARRRPVAVFCHTFHVSSEDVESLAKQFPAINFVTVCHSSQNHLFASQSLAQTKALKLSERLPNVWYATPEEEIATFADLGYVRVIQFPNPVPTIESATAKELQDPPTLLLVGRPDIVKAMPTAILAAGIVARIRPIKLAIVTQGSKAKTHIQPFLSAAKINADWLPWSDYEGFANLLREQVSIVLQPSLTESFNYVAIESMAEGRPVAGAPAIRYLPRSWQANPNDPQDIARVCIEILGDYTNESQRAIQVARQVREFQNQSFLKMVERLIRHDVIEPAASG